MDSKKILFSLSAALICLICSCTSPDDEQENILLPLDQPTTVTVAANQNSEQIRFIAMDSWSAYTSSQSRDVNDVEWIHLSDTQGSAGEVYLNFTLDYNRTGESRTAYIIIVSGDTKIVVTITQSSEDDPDVPNPINEGMIEIEVKKYNEGNGEGFYHDGTYKYEVFYGNSLPVTMISTWRDDLDSYPGAPADHDSYCLNTETTKFLWDGNDRDDIKSATVNMETKATYYPSERTEIEDISEHYAEIKDGRAVSGWYQWPREDLNRSEWEATYNASGFLVSSKNNDASPVWDTHTMSWTNGNLTKIVCEDEDGREISITYAEPSLLNLHQTFDINWVLPQELECYDFAAGDVTKVFATIGLMGKPSKNLITAIDEYDGYNTTYSYRMNYSKNTKDETIVTVMRFVNDVQTSYSEWTIKYTNIK